MLQYIPRNMHTVFALLCFVVVIHWLIFPYPSGLLHWHCGNLTIAPVSAKQPWWIWINTSYEFIMNDCITTSKQSTTKPCAYFLGYTVFLIHVITLTASVKEAPEVIVHTISLICMVENMYLYHYISNHKYSIYKTCYFRWFVVVCNIPKCEANRFTLRCDIWATTSSIYGISCKLCTRHYCDFCVWLYHYSDVIMIAIAYQITWIVCSAICSGADQRKYQAPRHWPLWGYSTGD